jgi:hypothetical protein
MPVGGVQYFHIPVLCTRLGTNVEVSSPVSWEESGLLALIAEE